MEFTIRVLGWALVSFEYEPTRPVSDEDEDDSSKKPFEAGSGGQFEYGFTSTRPRWSNTEPYGPNEGEVRHDAR